MKRPNRQAATDGKYEFSRRIEKFSTIYCRSYSLGRNILTKFQAHSFTKWDVETSINRMILTVRPPTSKIENCSK